MLNVRLCGTIRTAPVLHIELIYLKKTLILEGMLSYLAICRCFLRRTTNVTSKSPIRRMLRMARIEITTTLGFISTTAIGNKGSRLMKAIDTSIPIKWHDKIKRCEALPSANGFLFLEVFFFLIFSENIFEFLDFFNEQIT